jgi:hypothetical protein
VHLSNIRKYSYKEEGIVLIDPVLDAVRHSLYFRGKRINILISNFITLRSKCYSPKMVKQD